MVADKPGRFNSDFKSSVQIGAYDNDDGDLKYFHQTIKSRYYITTSF